MELLEEFLPTIIRYSSSADIYVIDNASTDDSIAFLTQNFPTIKQVVLDENYGFAKGYNEGLKHIDADLYCLLNNDVEVTENWLNPIIEGFKKPMFLLCNRCYFSIRIRNTSTMLVLLEDSLINMVMLIVVEEFLMI